jgi:hypothetical protein
MPQAYCCNCIYKPCNGKEVPKSTYYDHLRRDAALKAAVSTTAVQPMNQDQDAIMLSNTDPLPPPSLTTVSASTRPTSAATVSMEQTRLAVSEERGRQYALAVSIQTEEQLFIGPDDFEQPEEEGEALEDGPHCAPECPDPAPPLISIPNTLPLRHHAPNADPRYPGENHPDPFVVPTTFLSHDRRISPVTTSPPFYLLYLLVAWLHTTCKLAFSACGAVLFVVTHILACSGGVAPNLLKSGTPYLSLRSVLDNLGVEPVFQVLAVCPKCQEPHPAAIKGPSSCVRCASPLFKEIRSHDQRRSQPHVKFQPFIQCPSMSIESQLRAILAIPGMEDEMESWRHVSRKSGEYHDMFDGRVAKDVKGPDGQPFFQNPACEGSSELRVGAVLGFDWQVRLSLRFKLCHGLTLF